MRKFIISFIAVMLANIVTAQQFNDLDKSPMDAIMIRAQDNSSLARIIYSRPYKRNRKIFGELVKFDTLWRTGANEATEIKFYQDVLVNGNKIEKGTYTLFSIPHENEWTIIINSVEKSWGLDAYNESNDKLRTKVNSMYTATSVEQFSISVRRNGSGYNLLMGWDDRFVQLPIHVFDQNQAKNQANNKNEDHY